MKVIAVGNTVLFLEYSGAFGTNKEVARVELLDHEEAQAAAKHARVELGLEEPEQWTIIGSGGIVNYDELGNMIAKAINKKNRETND
jgi:hypothetical protein